jgi:hypothetical protein
MLIKPITIVAALIVTALSAANTVAQTAPAPAASGLIS